MILYDQYSRKMTVSYYGCYFNKPFLRAAFESSCDFYEVELSLIIKEKRKNDEETGQNESGTSHGVSICPKPTHHPHPTRLKKTWREMLPRRLTVAITPVSNFTSFKKYEKRNFDRYSWIVHNGRF